jgi:hypothetical protein
MKNHNKGKDRRRSASALDQGGLKNIDNTRTRGPNLTITLYIHTPLKNTQ